MQRYLDFTFSKGLARMHIEALNPIDINPIEQFGRTRMIVGRLFSGRAKNKQLIEFMRMFNN
ncbi:MAG: hypothetical protein ABIG70_13365 [Pseudomonadota bacterium]